MGHHGKGRLALACPLSVHMEQRSQGEGGVVPLIRAPSTQMGRGGMVEGGRGGAGGDRVSLCPFPRVWGGTAKGEGRCRGQRALMHPPSTQMGRVGPGREGEGSGRCSHAHPFSANGEMGRLSVRDRGKRRRGTYPTWAPPLCEWEERGWGEKDGAGALVHTHSVKWVVWTGETGGGGGDGEGEGEGVADEYQYTVRDYQHQVG
ncbi:hypothetical protein EDB85DRAFT_1893467 [Lactarius pseudohatsudake]|nr:hypothetical protein EDB85DRAFT_1893467 [Lactarius pseudohatsudake]